MANAFKCDVCGALFEGSPGVMPVSGDPNINVVILQARRGKDAIDICSSCTRSFAQRLVAKLDSSGPVPPTGILKKGKF